jgi:lambda repressor-like predicted transcriptional regulator
VDPAAVELITFLAAAIGYAGLAVVVLVSAFAAPPLRLWRMIALFILLHVTLVWAYRYEWQLGRATRNGYAGFVIFHAALVLIALSLFVRERVTVVLLPMAFVIVTAGAVGAVFRYEEVTSYRAPVLVCAVVGGAGLVAVALRKSEPQARARE